MRIIHTIILIQHFNKHVRLRNKLLFNNVFNLSPSSKHFALMQVLIVVYHTPLDSGVSKVRCFIQKSWRATLVSALSPGDKQIGWITGIISVFRNIFLWGGKQKKEKKKKTYNSPGLLPKPKLWLGSASQFSKSFRTIYWHVLWEKAAQLPHFLYLAQRDKVLDVSEKCRKGGRRKASHFLFW